MGRVESLLDRLLRAVELREGVELEKVDHSASKTNIEDTIGIDVVDPASASSAHPSQAAVVSIFQSTLVCNAFHQNFLCLG